MHFLLVVPIPMGQVCSNHHTHLFLLPKLSVVVDDDVVVDDVVVVFVVDVVVVDVVVGDDDGVDVEG